MVDFGDAIPFRLVRDAEGCCPPNDACLHHQKLVDEVSHLDVSDERPRLLAIDGGEFHHLVYVGHHQLGRADVGCCLWLAHGDEA
jgi:hypothetical protein